jgi:ribosomal protein L11 methyltransferase
MYLWTMAEVTATDIDPRAIEITARNAVENDIDLGDDISELELIVADGALHPRIAQYKPYDLVIANVLAGPLVSMAPELAAIAAPGATILLAGLLETQRAQVVDAYAECGCTLTDAEVRGDWTILTLRAGAERYVPTEPIDPKGRDGWALDI